MIKYGLTLAFIVLVPSLMSEEVYLEKIPWTGDWLPLNENNLVQGDRFMGYPGPLVKFQMAFPAELSENSIFFEENYMFDPAAPNWYGHCDGWAAASILYDDPGEVIVDGIKFFIPEVRALLTVSRADNGVLPLGNAGGVSAKQFDSLLKNNIVNNKSIIFDLAIGEEKWNYPVAGYEIFESTAGNGDTVYDVKLIFTQPISMIKQLEINFNPFFQAEYRYLKKLDGTFEWLSEENPELAWLPREPFFVDNWQSFNNRHIYPDLVQYFSGQESQGALDLIDLQEPNDSRSEAFSLKENITLSCVTANDRDFFKFLNSASVDESYTLFVYDGPEIQWRLYHSGSEELVDSGFGEKNLEFLTESPGEYILEVFSEQAEPSFYGLKTSNRSEIYLRENQFSNEICINIQDELIPYTNGFQRYEMAPYSTISIPSTQQANRILFGDKTVQFSPIHYSNISSNQGTTLPQYLVQKKSNVRTFPHVAHLFGWQTEIFVQAPQSGSEYLLRIFDKEGLQIEEQRHQVSGEQKTIDLGFINLYKNPPTGYWFSIEEINHKPFLSEVRFLQNELGEGITFYLDDFRNGFGQEFSSFLYSQSTGWNGLAIVNTSIRENEILARIKNNNGQEKARVAFYLKAKEKILTVVDELFEGVEIVNGDFLEVFGNFPIVGLQVGHAYNAGINGAFLHNDKLDHKPETVILNGSWTVEVLNKSNLFQHVLFEGYDTNGNLIGRFNTDIGKPVRPFSKNQFQMAHILENGITYGDIASISHFIISIPDDVILRYGLTQSYGEIALHSTYQTPQLTKMLDKSKVRKGKKIYDVKEFLK